MSYSFLITGASSGFGIRIALKALQAGHAVMATARNSADAAKKYPELEALGGVWLELDVTAADAIETVNKVVGERGVNVLINNAGYGLLGALEDMSVSEFQKQIDTNVTGPFKCIKGALPHFRTLTSQGGSTIVNISSVAGLRGGPSATAYAASKFGLEGLSESLAGEVKAFRIRVVLIEPGTFRTNFLTSFPKPAAGLGEAYKDGPVGMALQAFTELDNKQPGDPEQAAERILEIIEGRGMGQAFKEKGLGEVLRVPLGKDCFAAASKKVQDLSEALAATEKISASTDFA
ncbi:putative short chain oxidoreductase/dehydrogenase [Thelonectria olida]|uniref:Short chain oxidoreductase/dehydrogenase n=1 Tax=Thelonectria olida TaxID=1576542 RepID=A0A9P9AK40_9HYPO|nr:putative short chain oxidoreductase/dehydrogenase [Thelonectria olida]